MTGQSDPETNGGDNVAVSLQELSVRIEELQAEVRRLTPVLPAPAADGPPNEMAPPSYAWLSSLEPAVRRRPTVPRLLLEVLFLIAVAVAAGVAELDGPAIAGVMTGAWVLVALIEWAASRADRRRAEVMLRPLPAPPQPLPADPTWYVPPVEHTMHDPVQATGAVTVAGKLPPVADVEATGERRAT